MNGKYGTVDRVFYLSVWMVLAVSIFNALQLFWLGLTILLNAERRNSGVYLITTGLLAATYFFVSHTVIIAHELTFFGTQQLNIWWLSGWIPVIFIPFLWYAVNLWYAGYWDEADSRLLRRHRVPFNLMRGWMVMLILLLFFADAIPSYEEIARLDLSNSINLMGIPMLFALYPPYAMIAILLPVDALLRPEPSQRMMGDQARRRSRPWLIGVSLALAAVSFLVMLFIGWVVWNSFADYTRTYDYSYLPAQNPTDNYGYFLIGSVVVFDLLLSSIIAAGTIMLGRAVVSYEVFTGKTLPRQGFARHWRRAIWLSAGISLLASWNLMQADAYLVSLIFLVFVMMTFFVLTGWRSFIYRDQLIAQLRPFVQSQRMTGTLLSDSSDTHSRAHDLFHVVCEEMLNTTKAYLMPTGVLAPLAGQPLSYPDSFIVTFDVHSLSNDPVISLSPDDFEALRWAIPLYAERGLIGALLIGERTDGGLYAQEDIEIARATAERIIDMLAGEEMARRLLELQRQRRVETRVMDMQTRRILHDEILPTLHMAVLQASALEDNARHNLIKTMTQVHSQISNLIHAPASIPLTPGGGENWACELQDSIVEEFEGKFTSLDWNIEPHLPALENVTVDIVGAALREVVRNAAVHARGDDPNRPLNVCVAVQGGDRVQITVEDDGVGPGYETNGYHHGGAGGGLALHGTMLAIVGGTLTIDPIPGGTRATISVA
ncbi:MAG: hypothetical protein L0154_18875 [Chloroflexi bacterium]|nr:hypothetical protein [Chloroflexota bacterium]